MKILVVCQYYYPEPVRLPDICEELVKRGHMVTVLTGIPNYPMGKIYPGYEKGKKREEDINGVHVVRCWTYPRGTGTVKRLLNYFSYPIAAWHRAGRLEDEYDVVLVNQQSPVMMAWPGIRYGKKHGKKIVMYCMDLWPASLAAGGIRSGIIYNAFGWISKRVYRQMNLIMNTSRMFEGYLFDEFAVDKSRITHLPQYGEDIFEDVGSIKDGYVDLMFAGNIGAAQSLDTIIKAARAVKRTDVRWHIVGDGKELEQIKRIAEGMDNVIFYGRKPLEEMPEYYRKADAMLVTLMKDPAICLTLPGKVQTYMAAGKPVISAADGETKITVEDAECGYAVGSEDWKGLAKAVEAFADSDWRKLGKNSRAYFERYYQREAFLDRLEDALKRNCVKKL